MATAVDFKYVYVNYDAPTGYTDSNGNKTDDMIEYILPPLLDQTGELQTIDMHAGQPIFDEAAVAVQYITHNDQLSVLMVNDDEPTPDDGLDDSSHAQEDQLQRLTNELLLNNDDEEPTTEPAADNDQENTSISLQDEMSEVEEEDEEDEDSEQDLTNLAWLSDPNRYITVNYLAAAEFKDEDVVKKPAPKSSPKTKSATLPEAEPIDPKEQLVRDKNLTQERFNKFMVQVQECQQAYACKEQAYRDNAAEKPPFIYAQMIAMAMIERGRMTLKDIEQWIQERFAYYRCTGNWNNSIRHNLSIHFGFTKIARDKNEKGKGGYWELSMNITKGEKKRVRNRSKRGLVNGTGGAGAAKRPRRMATAIPATSRGEKVVNSEQVDANVLKDKSELGSAVASIMGGVTVMSDGYETTCSDGTTSNGYDQETSYYTTSSLLNDSANEIFLGCDIPLSGDCIIIPYTGPTSSSSSSSQVSPPQPLPPPATSSIASPQSSTTGIDSTPASPSFTVNSPADYNSTYLASQLTAHATLIAHGLTNPTFGPNVIVETLPYAAHHQAVLDQVVDIERQFSSMVQLPEPELMAEYDAYFDYSGCSW